MFIRRVGNATMFLNVSIMKITNTKDELLISIPKGLMDVSEIQRFIDLIRYKTIISKSQATDEQIAEVTNEINENLAQFNKRNRTSK